MARLPEQIAGKGLEGWIIAQQGEILQLGLGGQLFKQGSCAGKLAQAHLGGDLPAKMSWLTASNACLRGENNSAWPRISMLCWSRECRCCCMTVGQRSGMGSNALSWRLKADGRLSLTGRSPQLQPRTSW